MISILNISSLTHAHTHAYIFSSLSLSPTHSHSLSHAPSLTPTPPTLTLSQAYEESSKALARGDILLRAQRDESAQEVLRANSMLRDLKGQIEVLTLHLSTAEVRTSSCSFVLSCAYSCCLVVH